MKKQISELALIFVLCAVSVVLLSSCNKAKTDSGVTSAPAANSTSSTTEEQAVKPKNNIIIMKDDDITVDNDLVNDGQFLIIDGDNTDYDDRRYLNFREQTGILPKVVKMGTEGDYEYAIHEDGYAQIMKYNGEGGDIVIPKEIAGCPVAYIGHESFAECDPVEHFEIPEDQYKIKSVVIPDTVVSIGDNAFFGCRKLRNLKLGNNLFCISTDSFAFCESLQNVDFPISLQYIGTTAFEGTGITELKIHSNFKYLGWAAFADCKNLKKIQFDGGDIHIDHALIEGSGVEELYIPANLNIQGNGVMFPCKSLKRVKYAEKMDKDTVIYARMYTDCSNLEEIKLPSNITAIKSEAFTGCKKLKQIHIPKSVKSIGSWAFVDCNSLRDVYFESKDCEGLDDSYIELKYRRIHAPSGGNIEEFCKNTFLLKFIPTD